MTIFFIVCVVVVVIAGLLSKRFMRYLRENGGWGD